MKKMLWIFSIAFFVAFLSLPDKLFAQSLTGYGDEFSMSGSMMVIAGIIIALKVSLVYRIIITKKREDHSKQIESE